MNAIIRNLLFRKTQPAPAPLTVRVYEGGDLLIEMVDSKATTKYINTQAFRLQAFERGWVVVDATNCVGIAVFERGKWRWWQRGA